MRNNYFALLLFICAVQFCTAPQGKSYKEPNPIPRKFVSSLDSIYQFFCNYTPRDNVTFVIFDYFPPNSAEILFISKRAQKSDFEFMGTPLFEYNRNGRLFFLYCGIEQFVEMDSTFFLRHPSIYDDSSDQAGGIKEFFPTLKKAFQVENGVVKEINPAQNNVFTPKPNRDTIRFD